MVEINNEINFTDKFLTRISKSGFDFLFEKELKISGTKVKNLIYEVELKYRDNHNFIEQLILIIEKAKYEVRENKIKFALHNPLVKQYFKYQIRNLDVVSDRSFSKYAVTISKVTVVKLLLKLYGDSTKEKEVITSLLVDLREAITNERSLFKEFGKFFSSVSWGRSKNLLFDVVDPVNSYKRVFIDL